VKKAGFYLTAIAAVVIGLLVGTLNSMPVQLDLLWVQFELPLGLAVLMGFAAGVLVGLILLYLGRVLPLRVSLRKARLALARHEARETSPGDD
jgi:uncharacterized integral membrane protein